MDIQQESFKIIGGKFVFSWLFFSIISPLARTHTHTNTQSLSPYMSWLRLSVGNNAFFAWQKMPIYVPLFPSAGQR